MSTSTLAGPDDDRAYRAGIGLLNKGMHEQAAAELKTYLKDHGDAAMATSARYALGVCLVKLGLHADAAPELDRVIAVQDFEFAPDALLLRAQCAAGTGDAKGAIAPLEKLLKSYRDFAQADRAAALLGEMLYRTERYEDASAVLTAVGERWPKSETLERAGLFGALSDLAQGKTAEAAARLAALRARGAPGPLAANVALVEAQCRHRMGKFPEALALYDAARDRGDDAVKLEAMLGGAQVARAAGSLPEADKRIRELTQRQCPPAIASAAELERGRILLDSDKAAEAQPIFSALAGKAPPALADDAAYWSAKCELKLGRAELAAKSLAAAAEKFPASELLPDMLFDRASALARAGDDKGAAQALLEWRTRFPRHDLQPEAIAALAGSAQRLGEFAASSTLCQEFLASYRAHPRSALVELTLAENAFLTGEFALAETAYARFLKAHSDDAGAWRARVRRGLCLMRLNRDDDGAKVLVAAVEKDVPGDREPALARAALSALGEHAFAAADWPAAEKWFGALAKETAEPAPQADALLRQALSIQRQNRGAEALPLLQRVVTLAPDSPAALHAEFEIGQHLAESGKLDEAQKALESVIAHERAAPSPTFTPHALRHLASIASRQGKPEEAAAILTRAGDAGDGDALFQQGAAWLAAGKFAEAEKAYAGFLNSRSSDARAPEARARRAIALNRLGKNEDALAEFGAIAGAPASGKDEWRLDAEYEHALALRALKRDEEAAQVYRELLKQNLPPRLGAYAALDLAQVESAGGRHAEALALLDQCRKAAPSLNGADAAPLLEREAYVRGVCQARLAKWNDAAAALAPFAKDLASSPLAPAARLVLAEAYMKLGRAPDAVKELRCVLESKPSADIVAAAMLRLGEALAAAQQWSGSEEAYAAYLDRSPGAELWFQARFGQGWARENQGRHESAIEAYREVTARHQGVTAARAQFQIGECLYAMKRHSEAVGELLKVDVLYAYPDWSAAALYEAGRCLAESGRAADAAKQFDDLISRFPETNWARMARERAAAATPDPVPGKPKDSARARPPKQPKEK